MKIFTSSGWVIGFCLVSATMQAGITINGVDINQITQKRWGVSFSADESSSNISFIFDGKSLQIGTLAIQDKSYNALMASYENLKKQQGSLECIFATNKIERNERTNLTYNNSYLKCSEDASVKNGVFVGGEIFLRGKNININQSILSANSIFLEAHYLKLNQCFLEGAHYLQLEAKSVDTPTPFKQICFTLSPHAKLAAVHGDLSLKNGEMSQEFIVVGAKQIAILFHDSVFE